jgi:hypothetical protein
MMLHRFVCAALLVALGSRSAAAETCNLYQYYLRAASPGSHCADFTAPWQTPPVPTVDEAGNATFFPRTVPLCQGGLDAEPGGTPCTLATNEVHSLDGTRAFYHVDPVKGSRKWVIFLKGGGSCGLFPGHSSASEACYDGTQATDGFDGYATVTGDAFEMTSFHPGLGATNIRNKVVGRGPMRPDTGALFASWNRIIIDKTTFDRFMGNRTNASVWGNDIVNTYFHGSKIVQAMLNDLNQSRGAITIDDVTLTKLSEAECVVLIGNSGGAGGVIMLAERFKGWVNAIAPDAMVQFVADSRLLPDLNSEARFENPANSLWSNIAAGTTQIRSSVNAQSPLHDAIVAWSNDTYQNGGDTRELLRSWGDPASSAEPFLDPSCIASHAGALWPCFSEQHVLAHHTDEDFFLHQTLGDSVHGNTPLTYYDTIDTNRANGYNPIPADPGFRFNGEPSGFTFMNEKANRVIYAVDELLQNRKAGVRDDTTRPNPANRLGVYVAYGNCHTTSLGSAWQSHFMVKNGVAVSAEDALQIWLGSTTDNAWIQDTGPDMFNAGATWTATYRITDPSYRGWATTWSTCP